MVIKELKEPIQNSTVATNIYNLKNSITELTNCLYQVDYVDLEDFRYINIILEKMNINLNKVILMLKLNN